MSTDPCCSLDDASQVYCALREPIEDSNAIKQLSRYLKNINGFRVDVLYFISPEGVSRTIPHWDTSLTPAHRVYNGESYIYNTLSRASGQCRDDENNERYRYITLPYFDLTGNGVIETICYPVDLSSLETLGVFCGDIALPEQEVLSRLIKASAVFDISVVRVSPHIAPEVVACSKWFHPCDKKLSHVPSMHYRWPCSHFMRWLPATRRPCGGALCASGIF